MKIKNIFQWTLIFSLLLAGLSSCEETEWPNVDAVDQTEYQGTWATDNFRMKTTYVRTQDPVTKDFSVEEVSEQEPKQMVFSIMDKAITVTITPFVDGVAQAPVTSSGLYSLSRTKGSDYTEKAVYLNIWQNENNVHSAFSNPVKEPYNTFTIVRKTATEMELSWVLYNNTSQNSTKYTAVLKKQTGV